MRRIYLDHNATTPLHEEVRAEMLPYLGQRFGNPSSLHWFGQRARRAVDKARQRVADFIRASPSEIVFTSGGTEANNLAVLGTVRRSQQDHPHVITSAVEHPAVLNACTALEQQGVQVDLLPVDDNGRVDLEAVAKAITGRTVLISVMLANNDVGTIQPVEEVATLARSRGITMHTDAVQAAGKLPIDVQRLGVHLLSLSGHKIYGPQGIGALYIREGSKIAPLSFGGEHERGRRAGTENVAAIVGLGMACEIAAQLSTRELTASAELRDRLERGVCERVPGARVIGARAPRIPNTLNMVFSGVDGEDLQMNLDLIGIAVSTGSACASGTAEPSHVLTAMGLDDADGRSSIRFSLGRETTREEVDATIEAVVQMTAKLRNGR